jgi:hypothetical protein
MSRVVKSRHRTTEGITAMLFITPGVAENLFFAFDKEDGGAISTAAVQVNAGWRRRDDGSIVLLNRLESSTEAKIGNFKGATMECLSITVEGDVLYALVGSTTHQRHTHTHTMFIRLLLKHDGQPNHVLAKLYSSSTHP